MNTIDLAKLTPHDRDEVLQFIGFLQQVGRVPKGDPEEHRKLREWIAVEPEERLRYLGFTPEEGVRLGLAPGGREGGEGE